MRAAKESAQRGLLPLLRVSPSRVEANRSFELAVAAANMALGSLSKSPTTGNSGFRTRATLRESNCARFQRLLSDEFETSALTRVMTRSMRRSCSPRAQATSSSTGRANTKKCPEASDAGGDRAQPIRWPVTPDVRGFAGVADGKRHVQVAAQGRKSPL